MRTFSYLIILLSLIFVENICAQSLPDKQPQFKGGDAALMQYLCDNLKYPAEAQEKGIEGRVLVQFVIGKDGSVSELNVLQHVDPALDKEAMRVVESTSFMWNPGFVEDQPVRVKFTLPITFRLAPIETEEQRTNTNDDTVPITAPIFVGEGNKRNIPERERWATFTEQQKKLITFSDINDIAQMSSLEEVNKRMLSIGFSESDGISETQYGTVYKGWNAKVTHDEPFPVLAFLYMEPTTLTPIAFVLMTEYAGMKDKIQLDAVLNGWSCIDTASDDKAHNRTYRNTKFQGTFIMGDDKNEPYWVITRLFK